MSEDEQVITLVDALRTMSKYGFSIIPDHLSKTQLADAQLDRAKTTVRDLGSYSGRGWK